MNKQDLKSIKDAIGLRIKGHAKKTFTVKNPKQLEHIKTSVTVLDQLSKKVQSFYEKHKTD